MMCRLIRDKIGYFDLFNLHIFHLLLSYFLIVSGLKKKLCNK